MESQTWLELKQMFRRARELDADGRRAYLREVRARAPELVERLEALLAHDEHDSDFMELPPAAQLSAGVPPPAPDLAPGEPIGGYVVEEAISAGGMGVVYRARQESPRRSVALKVLNERFASPSARKRFEVEAQILAHLTHPHICQVFEAGSHASGPGQATLPYFAMEYVPGALTITEFALRHELGVQERLRLFLQACDAVHHGHLKGVIHRDLKPPNLLVDAAGEVKVIDFGVARATDVDLELTSAHTGVGQLLGTVQYMSPEQCSGDPRLLDLRSDVYSLGVVLYELLCGALPYDLAQVPVFEATRRIHEIEPRRPSSVDRRLRGDLETVVLRAIEKDRERRYQTVAELAADLRRYLAGEAILARPVGPVTRVLQRIRRNPVLRAGTSTGLVAGLVFVAYVLLVSLPGIRRERDLARRQGELAREAEAAADEEAAFNAAIVDFVQDMLAAPGGLEGGRELRMADVLDRAAAKLGETYAQDPRVEAELRSTLGWTYRGLGLYPEASAQLRRALELHARVAGPEAPETLADRVRLGHALLGEGLREEAAELLESTREAEARVFGPEHERTLYTRALLAHTRVLLGAPDAGMSELRRVFDLQRSLLGEGHRHTLYTGGLLAGALLDLGRYGEAEEIARVVAQRSRDVLGPEDPDTVGRLTTLARALGNNGKAREAEALYREAYDLHLQRNGPDHPRTMATREDLALLLSRRGALEEAEAMLREVVDFSRRTRGPSHPATLDDLNNLGTVLGTRGDMEAAREVFEELLALRLEVQGPEHSLTLGAMTNLAIALANLGESEEAEALYRDLLELRVRLTGREHPHTLQVRTKLAETLTALGQDEEAEAQAREALDALVRNLGDSHPLASSARLALARALTQLERYEEAVELFELGIELERATGEPRPFQEAALLHYLGRCLQWMERYEEAEARLLEGHRLSSSVYGRSHPLPRRGATALVQLYEAWGRPAQAARWRAEYEESAAEAPTPGSGPP